MEKFKLLRLNLQHFAEDPVEPSEPVEPTEPTSKEPVEPPVEKMLTQAEFEEALKQRLARERKKYEGFDELKTKASEYEKLVEEKRLAELSEQERLQEIARKHEEEKKNLAQQLEALQAKTREQLIINEFIKAAPSVNIPSDRIDAALKLADVSAVNIGEDGAVEGLVDVMSTLVEQYSFLVAEQKKPQRSIGEPSNNSANDEVKTLEAQLEEAKQKKDISTVIKLSNQIKQIVK